MPDEITPAANLEQPTPAPTPEPTGQVPVEPRPAPTPEPEPPKLTLDQIPDELVAEALRKKLGPEFNDIKDPAVLDEFITDAKAALAEKVNAAQAAKQAADLQRSRSFGEELAEAILNDQERDATSGKYSDRELSQRMVVRILESVLGSTNRAIQFQMNNYRNQEREADTIFRENPELLTFKAPIEQAMKQGHPPTEVAKFWLARMEEMKAAGVTFPERKPPLHAVQGGLSPSAYESLTEPVGGQHSVVEDENYAKAARERAEKADDETINRWLEETKDL